MCLAMVHRFGATLVCSTTALFLQRIFTRHCASAMSMPAVTKGSSSHTFALNVKCGLKPDRRDEFLRVIQADAVKTIQTEPGALQFTLGCDNSDANVFYFHEQYQTKSDFEHHCSTAHFLAWKEFCATEPFTLSPIVEFFHCVQHEPIKVDQRRAFCLNVKLCVKPEMRPEFLAVIDNNQKCSRREPLCLQYDYGESTEIANTFHFHEQYMGDQDGKEGFDAHARSAHFGLWEEFAAKDTFTSEPVVNFFQSIIAE
jgi:quinol monooxygenase YgiN